MEVIVEKMRKDISLNVQSRAQGGREQNTFSVSFMGENPRNVMVVTNKLASLFIEENLKVRELQAESTSNFLSKELEAVERELIKKEEESRKLKQRYMGELPQQLDANLRILERLQQQLKTTSDAIRAAEDRSIFIQSQSEQLKKQEPPTILPEPRKDSVQSAEGIPQDRIPEDPTIIAQWNLLKRDLESAQSKYTENHPDVISLKRKIASIEPNAKEMMKKQEAMAEAQRRELKTRREGASSEKLPIRTSDPALERILVQYKEQYNAALLEARRLRDEEKKLKEQINLYQTRIEETPKREQEILLITRDYNLLNANYQSLMNKKIQSQMAENLERKQQSEQFKILDPARLPVKPFKPERDKILLLGTCIGLVAGLGMAWFRETLDQSFHSESDLEAYLSLPILAVIPNLREQEKAIKT